MIDPTRIPEMLRDTARHIEETPAYEGADPDLLSEAADEIDRLRRKLTEIAAPASSAVSSNNRGTE